MRLNWKKAGVAAAIAGALLLAMAIVAFSQGHQGPPPGGGPGGFHGGPGGGPHDMLGHLSRELNLTDDQKAQVKKLVDSFEESTKALHEQLRALHESEPDPMSGAAFDEAAVRKAAQERAQIQVEMEVAHARLASQIYSVLTAEQKAKLAEMHQQMEQRRQQWESQHPRPANDQP
ncbi:MAG TPA: Spy/CpxP family protein refolding chaperone [Pyrinomonadaceae bacterium]|nr:Spy/CpxP family protein refolding chaperone [Pyrinomonadaceae bacterium]